MKKMYYTTTLFALLLGSGAMAQCKLSIGVDSGCIGDGMGWGYVSTINGAVTPYTFLWSNGAVTQYTPELPNGVNSVTVTDASGCSAGMEVVIDCGTKKEDCEFKTFTQGGWGAVPHGGNPGVYLHGHFASCFPNGLTIGCDRTLRLTSAQAVTDFLPSGSTPKKLQLNSYLNPGSGYNNVLAGQLVAATLSVTFDACDPNFSAATGWLGDAVIATGTFEGWTVSELLTEANRYIGNCPSNFTAAQLNGALTLLNENFDNGTVNGGYVECEKKEEGEKKMTVGFATNGLAAYPNPAREELTVMFSAAGTGSARITLLDMSGRMVLDMGRTSVEAGVQRSVSINTSDLSEGVYLLNMDVNGQELSKRVVVMK